MNNVTRILTAMQQGDPLAAGELLPLVYNELRRLAQSKLAHEPSSQTLQATALVHEAFLRLVGDDPATPWNSRGHYFAAAAEAMRRILIERARQRQSLKRGGDWERVEIQLDLILADDRCDKLVALDEALRKLEERDAPKAELVKLRFFAGLTNAEAAAALGISPATADRHWSYARAWLQREMQSE
ncbi:MAG: ECF-type sigma factor [Pirellulaceae bacterium]